MDWGFSQGFHQYYYAGSQRIAMRAGSGAEKVGLTFLLSDHLGSTSVSYDASMGATAHQGYMPWGAVRYGALPTDYTFTGQKSYASQFGLLFYNARWLDPELGRFIQPDTEIPDNYYSLDWDRYQYVRSNPVKTVDPTGHWPTPSKLLSIVAFMCDLTATAISGAGIIVEAFATAGGEVASPIPGVDGAAGFVAGAEFYNAFMNPIENRLGVTSLALVVTADALDQNHEVTQILDPITGQSATEIVFGADTTFTMGSIALGNTIFILSLVL